MITSLLCQNFLGTNLYQYYNSMDISFFLPILQIHFTENNHLCRSGLFHNTSGYFKSHIPFFQCKICYFSFSLEMGAIISVENHNVTCGLGSVVANCLAKNCPTVQEFVGVQDAFGQVGPQDFLMDEYGLRATDIVAAVKKAIKRK